MVLAIYACGQQCSTTNFSKKVYFLNNKVTSPKRFYLFMVSRRDWLWKPANIKVENNGDVVYAVVTCSGIILYKDFCK